MLRQLTVLLPLILSLGLSVGAQAADTDAINLADGNGLHIVSSTQLDDRMMDVTFSTSALPFTATVRIVVPTGYAANSQRYPVLYLLHGGGGDHTQWTDLGAEQDTANTPVILIQPGGGKGSWYADALVPGADGLPLWETYITTQLIPWVDAHLRTQNSRSARAIAGLSMGGYATMSYAARHPDLFVSASAFSGAVDTSGPIVANWIGVSPIIDVRLPYSIFGAYPADTALRQAHNPTNLAANLRGMHLAFYYGNGNAGPLDNVSNPLPNVVGIFMGWIQENQVYQMNVNMDNALNSLGIPHDEHYYGDGMHTPGYWARDFQQELPVIMNTFAHPITRNDVVDADFESAGNGPWVCVNNCGVDHNLGNAQSGQGNGWARNWIGWNDIHQTVAVEPNTNYHLTGWVRTSSNSHSGFFGARSTGGTVISEAKFTNSLNGYTQLSVNFNSGNNSQVDIYAGIWAAGDTWVQVDNVSLTAN